MAEKKVERPVPLTPEQLAEWREKTVGQAGPQVDREESIMFDGQVRVYTTRGATVADLIDTGRTIHAIVLKGDTYVVYLSGKEYRPGGVLGALRRRVNMSDEQRAAASSRLKAARALIGSGSDTEAEEALEDELVDDEDEDEPVEEVPAPVEPPPEKKPPSLAVQRLLDAKKKREEKGA